MILTTDRATACALAGNRLRNEAPAWDRTAKGEATGRGGLPRTTLKEPRTMPRTTCRWPQPGRPRCRVQSSCRLASVTAQRTVGQCERDSATPTGPCAPLRQKRCEDVRCLLRSAARQRPARSLPQKRVRRLRRCASVTSAACLQCGWVTNAVRQLRACVTCCALQVRALLAVLRVSQRSSCVVAWVLAVLSVSGATLPRSIRALQGSPQSARSFGFSSPRTGHTPAFPAGMPARLLRRSSRPPRRVSLPALGHRTRLAS